MLIHSQKCSSPKKIIDKDIILESIRLPWDISKICYANAILELI